MAKSLSRMKNRLAPWGESIACFSVIVFDPLLAYIVVVNEDKKCLSYVKNQGIMIGLVRSVSDFLFLIYFTIPRVIALRENKRKFLNYAILCCYVFCILPFPQVTGSLGYSEAVFDTLESWKKPCKNHTSCVNDDGFGIFQEFIEHDILGMTDFPRKLLFSLRWGCQSIGYMCQTLKINGESSQDLFVIEIMVIYLALFVLTIAVMQRNEQSDAVRVERRKLNVQHIRNCMLIKKLSENLQRQVIEECEQSVWIETRSVIGVDAVNLFNDHLPEDLKRMIKRELCLKLLKEVKEFGRWGEALLDELCDFVKLVSYPKHTRIVREEGTIDEMFFLVEGKLQYHNFKNAKTGGSACRRTITNYLRDGDFCGEELLAWFQADPYSSGLPISTKTIVALTNVVGFALMSDYLKGLLIKHHAALFLQSYWRKHQATRPIQLSWRRRRNTQTPPAGSLEMSIEIA